MRVPVYINRLKATIDFETRSACSLRKSGAWRYAIDPSTEVLCLGYRLPSWKPGRTALWHPACPQISLQESTDLNSLVELFDWITAGKLVEAHNAFFERALWRNILEPRYGAPPIADTQWRDSAAKAAAHALPRQLSEAGRALHLLVVKKIGRAHV